MNSLCSIIVQKCSLFITMDYHINNNILFSTSRKFQTLNMSSQDKQYYGCNIIGI